MTEDGTTHGVDTTLCLLFYTYTETLPIVGHGNVVKSRGELIEKSWNSIFQNVYGESEGGRDMEGRRKERQRRRMWARGDQLQRLCCSFVAGMLVCTRVAKVAVQPRALLDLRNRTQAFKRETKHNLLKEAHWLGNEGRAGSERHVHLVGHKPSTTRLWTHYDPLRPFDLAVQVTFVIGRINATCKFKTYLGGS